MVERSRRAGTGGAARIGSGWPGSGQPGGLVRSVECLNSLGVNLNQMARMCGLRDRHRRMAAADCRSCLAWTLTPAQGCAPTEPPVANSLTYLLKYPFTWCLRKGNGDPASSVSINGLRSPSWPPLGPYHPLETRKSLKVSFHVVSAQGQRRPCFQRLDQRPSPLDRRARFAGLEEALL